MQQPHPQSETKAQRSEDIVPPSVHRSREETQPCPRCGHAMPALKGGSASICPNCGFKDSCCY
ncbi:MAG: hypothetical protein ACR2JW_03795 [Thermomicrobiales bacterium]